MFSAASRGFVGSEGVQILGASGRKSTKCFFNIHFLLPTRNPRSGQEFLNLWFAKPMVCQTYGLHAGRVSRKQRKSWSPYNRNDPCPPLVVEEPFCFHPIKQSTKQRDARGASEVRRGTSSIHLHCLAPRSYTHIGHGIRIAASSIRIASDLMLPDPKNCLNLL